MVDLVPPSDKTAAFIKEEVAYAYWPNNCQLPIQKGDDETGNEPLCVGDGIKKEVLGVHFQDNLYTQVKEFGDPLADQSKVLETKESNGNNTGMKGIQTVSNCFPFSTWYKRILVVGGKRRWRRQYQCGNSDHIIDVFMKLIL